MAGDALAFYLYRLVGPVYGAVDFGRTPAMVIQQGWLYLAWLLPVATLAALACLRNRRIWLIAAAVFIAWTVPVLGLVPFDFQGISTVADRYLYLAMLGPALALGWFLSVRWNAWTAIASAGVLCLLGVLSWHQTSNWRDNFTLFEHGVRVNSRSILANHNLAYTLAREGLHGQAIPHYQAVLQLNPRHVMARLNLATSLLAVRQTEQAEQHLREALRLKPGSAELLFNLGNISMFGRGDPREAAVRYRAAIQADPEPDRRAAQPGDRPVEVGRRGRIDPGVARGTRPQAQPGPPPLSPGQGTGATGALRRSHPILPRRTEAGTPRFAPGLQPPTGNRRVPEASGRR